MSRCHRHALAKGRRAEEVPPHGAPSCPLPTVPPGRRAPLSACPRTHCRAAPGAGEATTFPPWPGGWPSAPGHCALDPGWVWSSTGSCCPASLRLDRPKVAAHPAGPLAASCLLPPPRRPALSACAVHGADRRALISRRPSGTSVRPTGCEGPTPGARHTGLHPEESLPPWPGLASYRPRVGAARLPPPRPPTGPGSVLVPGESSVPTITDHAIKGQSGCVPAGERNEAVRQGPGRGP